MDDIIPQKRCTKCLQNKPHDEFYTYHTTKKDGNTYTLRKAICKKCDCAASSTKNFSPERLAKRRSTGREYAKNYIRDPRSRRDSRLKSTFGITLEQYEKMLEAQHGVCWICHKPETARSQVGVKPLAVDHDHKTGKIRGLLCASCNTALAHFENTFEKFMAYLDHFSN